ncbi:Cathepsin L-like protein, partial [Leptotrombidium deliense]
RRSIFVDNLKKIVKHNLEADLGLHSYVLGVNKFADLTSKEFSQFYKGRLLNKSQKSALLHKPSSTELPESVDWREKGQHAKATGKLVSLSEQQLVDCSKKFDNEGCNGGLMTNSFRYVIAKGGIDTEESYPYEAVEGECRVKNGTIGAKISKYVEIKGGNESALQDAVANIGPISVAIEADKEIFQFYHGGVLDDSSCGIELNHGVAVVGYGTAKGKDYWIVKNSWGTSWGEKGYIRIARNKNICGISLMASYPLV